ncbi:hypothetical protein SAMN05443574_102109 [Haloarcula vallismortis]|uniref:Uncharacterized protein n=1 Tax=Haloarcula vallismortis TaxID=28442 RepID=A0A1H2RY70_HALVA|nr:hypothetical protein SAMN05443574_102109 [Haloarcula vallismortis]
MRRSMRCNHHKPVSPPTHHPPIVGYEPVGLPTHHPPTVGWPRTDSPTSFVHNVTQVGLSGLLLSQETE